MNSYCIFCKTGSEKIVEKQVNKLSSTIKAIAPRRILWEKRGGKWESTDKSLLPGYVFLYFEDDLPEKSLGPLLRNYRLLQYENGKRELWGYDYDYAMWLYKYDGRIEESKALYEGDTVKIINGPLTDGIGKILKLDRHKRRAMVEFEFAGKSFKVSLSVVDIQSCE